MVRTWPIAAFYGVILLVGVPLVIQDAVALPLMLGVAAAILLYAKLDGWQRLWVVVILLFFCSTSNQHALIDLAYAPRYLMVVLLAAFTWATGTPVPLSQVGKPAARLVAGLWACAGIGFVSVAWSVDRQTTLLQSMVLGSLAWLVHGLVTRRWQDEAKTVADLGIAGLTFATLFAVGIAADAAGVLPAFAPGTPDADRARLRGYFDNPQALGITATVVLLVLFGVWIATKNHIYLIAIVPCAWSVLASESRTGEIAIVLSLLWVALRDRARVKHLVGVMLAALGVVIGVWGGFVSASALSSPFTRFTADQGGGLFNSRNVAWNLALTEWRHQPVGGFGYGAGPALFHHLRETGVTRFVADVAHNSYLQWFMETGIIGLIPVAIVLTVCFSVVFRSRIAGLNGGLVAAVFAGLMVQFTESAMFGTGSNYPFLFWPVVAAAAIRRPAPPTPIDERQLRSIAIDA